MTKEIFEHSYSYSYGLLRFFTFQYLFLLKLVHCMLHNPTKCGVTNDVTLFPIEYHMINYHNFLISSNQRLCYICKYIRIIV